MKKERLQQTMRNTKDYNRLLWITIWEAWHAAIHGDAKSWTQLSD